MTDSVREARVRLIAAAKSLLEAADILKELETKKPPIPEEKIEEVLGPKPEKTISFTPEGEDPLKNYDDA